MSAPRSHLTNVKQTQMVSVECIDNGKKIKAELISQYPDKIIVELPGGLQLTMVKHRVYNDVYIASNSGLEFQCNPRSK